MDLNGSLYGVTCVVNVTRFKVKGVKLFVEFGEISLSDEKYLCLWAQKLKYLFSFSIS